MKKQTKGLLTVIVIVILIAVGAQYILRSQTNLTLPNFQQRNLFKLEESTNPTETVINIEKVSIDFGNGQKLNGEAATQSAYQALVKVAKDNNLSVEVKQYKYGVMVEKVGDVGGTQNSAWMYFVNGKPGQIAADRYVLHPGDKVEWVFQRINQ